VSANNVSENLGVVQLINFYELLSYVELTASFSNGMISCFTLSLNLGTRTSYCKADVNSVYHYYCNYRYSTNGTSTLNKEYFLHFLRFVCLLII
jgi:hypothetical protein